MRITGREDKLAGWIAVCFLVLALPVVAAAHCDTMDGPVIVDAQKALEKGDVTPVLKWVSNNGEAEIRMIFKQTMAVRKQSGEAKELADRYFFETLVRLHRLSEGAPYTGLKPAGTDMGPAVKGADLALETGSEEPLVKLLTDQMAGGIRKRFAAALEKKKHAADSVAAGREFVKAYVEFVHYVERLHLDASGVAAHHGEATEAGEAGGKHH